MVAGRVVSAATPLSSDVRLRWGEKGTQGCGGFWMLGLITIGLHLLALES
jgi:hypothetical protein